MADPSDRISRAGKDDRPSQTREEVARLIADWRVGTAPLWRDIVARRTETRNAR